MDFLDLDSSIDPGDFIDLGYQFGTSTTDETTHEVAPDRRSIVLRGVPADQEYSAQIFAFRAVDKDIASNGVILSPTVAAQAVIPDANVVNIKTVKADVIDLKTVFGSTMTASAFATAANASKIAADAAKIAAEAAAAGAQDSKNIANTAATNANTAKTDAQAAKTAAEAAQTLAQTAATNAGTSATNASGFANTASGQATIATQKATDAGTSASNAQASASTASTQAGLASGYRSDAQTAATDAQGSATAASTSQGVTAANTLATSLKIAALIPERTDATGSYFYAFRGDATRAGDPADRMTGLATSRIVNDANGYTYTLNTGDYIGAIGAIGIRPGRVYELSAEFVVTAYDPAGTATVNQITTAMNSTYGATVHGSNPVTVTGIGTITTPPYRVSLDTLTGVIKLPATSVYIRPNARFNSTSADTKVAFKSTSIKDVTEVYASEQAALNASGSASAAAGSASTAATQSTNAGTSASAANTAKTNAETAAGNAQTFANNASTSATNAEGFKNTASSQAGVAATAAQNATDKATAAATSASNAGTSETNAGISATSANTAKTAAETARGQAQTYANNASTSADNALGSANTATTQAGVSSSSAASAQSVANRLLPSRIAVTADFVSETGQTNTNAFPENLTAGALVGTVVNDANLGQVREFATAAGLIFQKGWLPIGSGRTFRITGIASTPTLPAQLAVGFKIYNASGNSIAGYGYGQTGTEASGAAVAVNTPWSVILETNSDLIKAIAPTAAYIRAVMGPPNVANARVATLSIEDTTTLQQAVNTVLRTLPDRPAITENFASAGNSSTGKPENTPAVSGLYGGTVVSSADRGDVRRFNSNGYQIQTRGWLPIAPGRIYKATASGQAPAASGYLTVSLTAHNSAGVYLGQNLGANGGSGSYIPGGWNSPFAQYTYEQIIAVYPTAAFIRANIYGDLGTNAYADLSILRLEDVTGSVLAQQSASAAATSASTATTKAGEAGTSATAANTARTNAETAAGNAQTYATNASTSANNAQGFANTATTQAGVSSTSAALALITSINLLPETPDQTTFTNSAGGAPNAVANTTQAIVAQAFDFRVATSGPVYLKGVVPVVSGRTYRIEISTMRRVAGTSANVRVLAVALDINYAVLGTYLGTSWGALATATTFGDNTICSAVLTDYPTAAYLRYGVARSANGDSSVSRVTVTDVTNVLAAAGSASAAATSASTAGTQATNAGTSATAANTSATNANTSAGQAQTYASNAATSASDALGYRNTASTQAGLAASSAQLASDKAGAAAGSATAAQGSASAAQTSATNAGTAAQSATDAFNLASASAGTSTTQAGISTTQAANAQASANAASTSAAAAATSTTIAASVSLGGFTPNPVFSDFPNAAAGGVPAAWVYDANGTSNGYRVAGQNGTGFAYRLPGVAGQSAYVGTTAANSLSPNGWYVIEADVILNAGTFVGAGVLFRATSTNGSQSSDYTINFAVDRDITKSYPGVGVVGKPYRFRKLVQTTPAFVANTTLYLMTHWVTFGSVAVANDITWLRCQVRAASEAEVDGTTALSNTATLSASVTQQAGAIATIQGRQHAYWEVGVNAGLNAEAFISAKAEVYDPSVEPLTLAGDLASFSIVGRTVTKTAGSANDWDRSVYSTQGYTGGAYTSFIIDIPGGGVNFSVMGGLNSDPATNSSYQSIDYAFYVYQSNYYEIFENGVKIGDTATFTSGSLFSIEYQATNVVYKVNGSIVRRANTTAGRSFAFDSSFYNTGAKLKNIVFGPRGPVTGSSVGIGATDFSVYNNQDGTFKRAMSVSGGNAIFTGGLAVNTFIRLGSGAGWPVALATRDFQVSNGVAVSYGTDLGTPPAISFGPCPIGLNNGEAYRAYVANSTATGFTPVLEIVSAPTTTNSVAGPAYASGANVLTLDVGKDGSNPTNGTYTVAVSGTVKAYGYYEEGENCIWVEAFLQSGVRGGDAVLGDDLLLLDERDYEGYVESSIEAIRYGFEDCVTITTVSGIALTVSKSTPITLHGGEVIKVMESLGVDVPVLDNGEFRWEAITSLEEAGMLEVALISAGNGTYAAGNDKTRQIFTHNLVNKN